MKVRHVVDRAPLHPQPGVTYGARMEGLGINGNSIVARWAIFGHKNRKKGRKRGKVSKDTAI